jgi:hypothetical protein
MSAVGNSVPGIDEDLLCYAAADALEYCLFPTRAVVDEEWLPPVGYRRLLPEGSGDDIVEPDLIDGDTLIAQPKDPVIGGDIPTGIGKFDCVVSFVAPRFTDISSFNPFGTSDRAVNLIFEFRQAVRSRSNTTVIVEYGFRSAPVGNRQNRCWSIRVNRVAVIFVAVSVVVL